MDNINTEKSGRDTSQETSEGKLKATDLSARLEDDGEDSSSMERYLREWPDQKVVTHIEVAKLKSE